jgi:hypothetical protein
MKRCAQCGRTYADESLAFCLADGSLLSAPYDPNATLRMSPPTNPTATEVLPSGSVSKPVGKPVVLYLSIALAALIVGGVIVAWMKSGGIAPSAKSPDAPETTPTAGSTTPRPEATLAPMDIGGDWRDQFGFISHIAQQGVGFQITVIGKGCRGRFVTNGRGTVRGNTFEFDYTSSYSSGHCAGTVSPDGMQTTSDCLDSVCGRFLTSTRRQ